MNLGVGLAVHIKNIAASVFRDVDEKHIMAFAAGLSYYFVLSVFPLLILCRQWSHICPFPVCSAKLSACSPPWFHLTAWPWSKKFWLTFSCHAMAAC